jgi:hypothetical protein
LEQVRCFTSPLITGLGLEQVRCFTSPLITGLELPQARCFTSPLITGLELPQVGPLAGLAAQAAGVMDRAGVGGLSASQCGSMIITSTPGEIVKRI